MDLYGPSIIWTEHSMFYSKWGRTREHDSLGSIPTKCIKIRNIKKSCVNCKV